ncbi:MAG: hypothetical protein ACYDHP_09840 [Ferrimicrobium sp.]
MSNLFAQYVTIRAAVPTPERFGPILQVFEREKFLGAQHQLSPLLFSRAMTVSHRR